MSNWQEWMVWLLLTLCVARIILGGVRFFRRARRGESPCTGCPHGAGSHKCKCSSTHCETKAGTCFCEDSSNVSRLSEEKKRENDKKTKKCCCG